ncbi:BnaC04g06070D [Brassica napus]|uniref:BnaC04g06070D protein n=1 Tax=Brassica napus TaxID=3708 RepID=A0A078G661_BRANA|nr:BnaC04g06070D [Brassica napus]
MSSIERCGKAHIWFLCVLSCSRKQTVKLTVTSSAPINTYYTRLLASPIVERLRVLRRGGLPRAAPRNQSRRGFLKPLILPSLLFFEMEETVFIGEDQSACLNKGPRRNRSDDDKRRKLSPLERKLKLQDMWTCLLH